MPGKKSDSEEEEVETDVKKIVITLWLFGFTIDDGELRLYEVEGNMEMLQDIEKG